jgi:hypothetical protein
MEIDKPRAPISKEAETQLLTMSQRKCCLCYYVTGNKGHRKGQIAHLNRDRSNSEFNNLVYLCLEHHDEFDSRTSQSKGFTPEELRRHRDRLYHELGTAVSRLHALVAHEAAGSLVNRPL